MWKLTLKRIIRHLGYEIHRRNPPQAGTGNTPPGANLFVDQKRLFQGRPVRCIFDLGAHVGNTVAFYRSAFPDAAIHAFEPHSESFAQLRDRYVLDENVRCVQAAVSDFSGSAEFFSNRREYTNSLLPIHSESGQWVPEEITGKVALFNVSTITLDAYCEINNVTRVDLLKSDIQGAELKALQGATGLLSRGVIDVLMLEVLFAPLYEGQANFSDLVTYLSGYNYRLLGIYSLNRGANGLAGWADAIWVRDGFAVSEVFKASL